MQTISGIKDLKAAISDLEAQKDAQRLLLKTEFTVFYKQLTPANLVRSAVNEMTQTPELANNIVTAIIGIGVGNISKKLFTTFSGNPVRGIIGSALQYGITNIVTNHPDAIKAIGNKIGGLFKRKHTAPAA